MGLKEALGTRQESKIASLNFFFFTFLMDQQTQVRIFFFHCAIWWLKHKLLEEQRGHFCLPRGVIPRSSSSSSSSQKKEAAGWIQAKAASFFLFFSRGETINSRVERRWDNLYGRTDRWRSKLGKDWLESCLETSRRQIYEGRRRGREKRITGVVLYILLGVHVRRRFYSNAR